MSDIERDLRADLINEAFALLAPAWRRVAHELIAEHGDDQRIAHKIVATLLGLELQVRHMEAEHATPSQADISGAGGTGGREGQGPPPPPGRDPYPPVPPRRRTDDEHRQSPGDEHKE